MPFANLLGGLGFDPFRWPAAHFRGRLSILWLIFRLFAIAVLLCGYVWMQRRSHSFMEREASRSAMLRIRVGCLFSVIG